MKNIITNAFSLQMLDLDVVNQIKITPIDYTDVPTDCTSAVGHQDTAAVISSILNFDVPQNRISIKLDRDTTLFVAQLAGGRLPDGCTTLPDGFNFKWVKVNLILDYNTGDFNSGNYNSGDFNSGNKNIGNSNSGDYNTGNWNSGDKNTGNFNSGDYNSGNSNSGNYSNGMFNTDKNPKIRLFNKESDLTFIEALQVRGIQIFTRKFSTVYWIYSDDMTEQEKEEHPEYKTLGGYLKTINYKDAWGIMWNNLTDEEKEEIKKIPNFDKKTFFEITRIEI